MQSLSKDPTLCNAESMKKGIFKIKRYVNELKTYNRLKFKIASGTHSLRSGLSRREDGSNICVCWQLVKEESVEHVLLECPLYNKIRDEILLQIMYSSDRFQKEWFDGDDAHR
eukprot:Awhi_evm1s5297